MACEPSRRDSYSRKLAAEDTLSKHLLDQSPSADAVMHAAHRTAWHSLLTRFSTLQVPSPTTTLCAHSPTPRWVYLAGGARSRRTGTKE